MLHFCLDDGQFNDCQYAAVAAVRFLEEYFKVQVSSQAAYDLKRLLIEEPTQVALYGWAKSNFH